MRNKLHTIVALTATLAPVLVHAIGFGEITLQSRIGEPLMAEVPILGSEGTPPIATCFSLIALRGSDFPVVTAAKPRLIRRGPVYILQLVGNRPVSEPIFAIGLQAACGYDLERQYVLMPEPPIELAQTTSVASAPPPPGRVGRTTVWQAREGQTIEDIADAHAPTGTAERDRLLAALKRANPDIAPDMPLAEGAPVNMPTRQPARPPRRENSVATNPSADAGRSTTTRAPKPVAPAAKTPPPPVASPAGADRLVLGGASETSRPSQTGNSGLATLAETKERLLKLESTLHRLTLEMEKMDQAIDLATKAIEVQNRLQLAQNVQIPSAPSVAAVTPAHAESSGNWLELLLSAAVGATASIGMAQYLGRRRRYPGDDQVPLAFSGYHVEVVPSQPPGSTPLSKEVPVVSPEKPNPPPSPAIAPSAPLAPVAPPSVAPLFAAPECDIPLQPEPEVIEAKYEDEHSVLALAEIMLSFGRLRGAADTLAEHIEQNLPQSFEPWNMLLDLYRRGGMRQEFEALAAKMRDRFNANIPAWNDTATPISGLKTLEDFPHAIAKTSRLWGYQEGIDYLYSLVHDTRAGQRNGFPLEVVEEIALLMRVQVEAYGLRPCH